MKRVHISFGGSHRKNARCFEALKPYIEPGALAMPATLNSKRIKTTAYDSPEMRAALKALGGTVCQRQPSWLNS